MARMLSGGTAAECGERAFQSSMEMMLSRLSEVELEQVMLSLGAGYIGGEALADSCVFRLGARAADSALTIVRRADPGAAIRSLRAQDGLYSQEHVAKHTVRVVPLWKWRPA